MAVATAPEVSSIAIQLKLREEQVHNLVALLDEGCTIPFITRYRKDQTGGLDEEQIRSVAKQLEQHRLLAQRKETILRSIDSQGKLTPELRAQIEDAESIKRLEDLYLPFKPKKQTLASAARDRGLGPLAEEIRSGECQDADARAADFVNPDKSVKTAAEALLGAGHILAESFSEIAELRHKLRLIIQKTGKLVSARTAEEAAPQQAVSKPEQQPAAAAEETKEPIPETAEQTALAATAPPESGAECAASGDKQAKSTATAESSQQTDGTEVATVSPESGADADAKNSDDQQAADAPQSDQAAGKPADASQSESKPPQPATLPAESPQAAKRKVKKQKKQEAKKKQDEKLVRTFQDFFEFSEELATIPPHRILAINRGERAKILKARVDADVEAMQQAVDDAVSMEDHPHKEFLRGCGRDALNRLIFPSLEREFRRELTDESENHAVGVFARNLRSLLLRQPVAGRRVLAIDPGFRSGCKIVAIDEFGKYLENTLIYVTGKGNRRINARLKLAEFIKKHNLNVVVIGNGTACRETESLIAELIAGPKTDELRGPEDEPRQNLVTSEGAASAESNEPAAEGLTTGKEATEPSGEAESSASSPETAKGAASEPLPNSDSAIEGSAQEDSTQAVSPQPAAEPQESSELSVANDEPASTPEAAATEPEKPATELASADGSAVSALPQESKKQESEEKLSQEKTSAKSTGAPNQPAGPRKLSQSEFDLLNDEAVRGVSYSIVNEAGASVYSTSTVGREEFPKLDATVRGAVSIGRRLQDPLSELVKIDPGNIGVGMYQHDVKAKHLRSSLDDVVESCVNFVGVDVNTASVPLLRYVSGLNQLTARRIYEFRSEHGPIKARDQLKEIPGIGEAAFVQSAGFLRISDSENPLDGSWIHPENYETATQVLEKVGAGVEALKDKDNRTALAEKLKTVDAAALADELGVGVLTLQDIMQQMVKPGRDPRDDLPPPVFRREILKLEHLQPGMELSGSVLNVVDFGVFIDIGLKDSGLVHISRISNGYVSSPHDVVSVGDIVKVWVVEVDPQRRRVSLTMIQPGTERPRPERGRKDQQERQSRTEGGGRSGNTKRGGERSSGSGRGGDRSRGGGRPQGRGRKGGRPQPRHDDRPRVFEKKSAKPPAKLSEKMKKGKEPLRTFGQLEQLLKMDDGGKEDTEDKDKKQQDNS
ncbi:MAG: helix-hairpin-helix domain-containing protein [Pirellulales bacterium]|nr:helix-hairpin-helix domain-containing protein [Pirellulales bacterium]